VVDGEAEKLVPYTIGRRSLLLGAGFRRTLAGARYGIYSARRVPARGRGCGYESGATNVGSGRGSVSPLFSNSAANDSEKNNKQ